MKDKEKDKDKELNFEKALADLEHIVEKLEKGGLSLSESLGLFEKGVGAARYLRSELDRAEKRVDILLKDEKGGLKTAPFSAEEAESECPAAEASGESDADDEGGSESPKRRAKARPKKGEDDSELPF
jgi:exodeoxyribonuclease VII small subunit